MTELEAVDKEIEELQLKIARDNQEVRRLYDLQASVNAELTLSSEEAILEQFK